MRHAVSPFPLPEALERNLFQVLTYWRGLRRAENIMPFWDDLRISALSDQTAALFLINVFDRPERFRFDQLTGELMKNFDQTLTGKFIDEIDLSDFFAYLRAQCSATVEARAPTYYRDYSGHISPVHARILLPMWGDGRIGMLLGAIDRQ
jgi:hypothetical protein